MPNEMGGGIQAVVIGSDVYVGGGDRSECRDSDGVLTSDWDMENTATL